MAKEELVSSEEQKKQTSLGGEGEKRERKELLRRDEPEDFQTLYEESLKTLEEGQILRGIVVDITPDHVTVDVGYKSEGQIPMQEFLKRDKKVDVKIGDRIDVLLEREQSNAGILGNPYKGRTQCKNRNSKRQAWGDL
jgi:ribosomal protein S1